MLRVAVFALLLVSAPNAAWAGWATGAAFLWALIGMVRRTVTRGREYDTREFHEPYQPVAHVVAYKCWNCGSRLPPRR